MKEKLAVLFLLAAVSCFHPQPIAAADELNPETAGRNVQEKTVNIEKSEMSGGSDDTASSVSIIMPGSDAKTDLAGEKTGIPSPLTAYIQVWYVYEQVENSKKQEVTGDSAADISSGFSINRARVEFQKEYGGFGGKVSARFDGGTPGLLDAYGYYKLPFYNIRLACGQMKIPSTYETGQSDTELDFVTRTAFSNEIVNWSLSKSPSSVSPFTSVQTQSRDTGIGITAEHRGFKLYTYAGNGLGANMFIGAEEKKQTVYSNSPGDMFYGIRGDADILRILSLKNGPFSSLVIGGHICRNKHDNYLYNDTRTVLDMERSSWSSDMHLELLKRINFTAMYGSGRINDNLVDSETTPNVTFKGYELKITGDLFPELLRIGYRFDGYIYKNKIFGGSDRLYTHTAGISIWPYPGIRITADYKWKKTGGDLNPDLDDDIMILQTQFVF